MGLWQIATTERNNHIHKRSKYNGTQRRNSTPGDERDESGTVGAIGDKIDTRH